MKRIAWLSAALCLLVGSCRSMTVEGRIAECVDYYNSLPTEQQTLVRAGRVGVGMSPQTVRLALGAPSSIAVRLNPQGHLEETWRYTRLQPVALAPTLLYSSCGFPYIGDSWVYQQRTAATVVFREGKVVGWEQDIR